jgi:GDP-4-dehydro-6-deoxy-D-mannose reductase
VGSGQVYGDPGPPEQSLNERCVLRQTSPYATSKAAADLLGYQYFHTHRLAVVRARPFNHVGPGQSEDFAISHFARQVAAISLGRKPPLLQTGNLEPRRDLTDVRDMVEAYLLLMDKGKAGEAYNIGSGACWSMHEVVDRLLKIAKVTAEIRQREDLVRAREVLAVRADASKLQAETGWKPTRTLEQTLRDTLESWKSLLQAES